MSARRHYVIAVAAMAASCTALSCTGPRPASPAGHAHPDAHAPGRAPATPMTLQVMPAPNQLPAGVSREVVLPGAA